MPPKLFSFTLLSKNASTNYLESHSCKKTGLKVPCFHTLTKNIGGRGSFRPTSDLKPPISALRLSALDSALTLKRASKSFTSNTYEKHTQGEGGLVAQASACDLTRFGWLALNVLEKGHQSQVTNHQSPVSPASLTLPANPAIKLALPFVFAR